MIDPVYFRQAELLLQVLPFIDREAVFALKGGTAINFFVRDLPRISIDIDLTYLPIGERESSLREMSNALIRISENVESNIPGTRITAKKVKGTDFLNVLFVRRGDATVKIEPNLVIRGSVLPHERRIISPKAREIFEVSMECRTLSENELYAGKICAALDRQHPRDLFDIFVLLRHNNFNADMRKAFIVYLISHERPIVEILNPRLTDIRHIFEAEFENMTMEEVTYADLENTRKELIAMIDKELTVQERQFILSVKEGMPQWDLAGIEGIENLPAVKWKILNINKMNPSKHKNAVRKLRDYLGV